MSDTAQPKADSSQQQRAALVAVDGSTSAVTGSDAAAGGALGKLADALQCQHRESLASLKPSANFLRKFSIAYARSHQVLGFEDGEQLLVAICDREGFEHLDIIGRALRRDIEPIVASAGLIQKAINAAYADRSSQAQEVIDGKR